MGRQAYITRLALGRSPYEAPVLSESGEFILAPYAHELDDHDGYVQQYNERGHPEFRASRVAARELRRAKNDVLSTVGLVYKSSDLPGRRMEKGKLVELARSEHIFGCSLIWRNMFANCCSLWWIHAMRMRIQAFQTHSRPLMHIARSELHTFGAVGFFCAGLPESLFWSFLGPWSAWSNSLRRLLPQGRLQKPFTLLSSSIYYTISGLGILRGLHLLPTGRIINAWSRTHPNFQPLFRLSKMTIRDLTYPLCLLWIYVELSDVLQGSLKAVIRGAIPMPDNSDMVSWLAYPGDRIETNNHFRQQSWSWRDEVGYKRYQLRVLFFRIKQSPLGRFLPGQALQAAGSLPEQMAASAALPNPEAEVDRASTATPDPEDLFNMEDVLPQETETNNLLSRTNTLFTPLNRSPATTPPVSPHMRASLIHRDSQTVTMQLELLELQRSPGSRDRNGPSQEPRSAPPPREDIGPRQRPSMEGGPQSEASGAMFSHAEAVPETDLAQQRRQGMDENAPSETEGNQSRFIEVPHADYNGEGSISYPAHHNGQHIREADLPPYPDQSHHHDQQDRQQRQQQLHHCTVLSTCPAEAFSLHLAHLLTTAALLPLENILVRSFTSLFTSSSSSSPSSRSPFGGSSISPSFTSNPHFSPTRSSLTDSKYYLTMLTLLGVQGLISTVVWGIQTGVVITIGKSKYRWGRGEMGGSSRKKK